ncbi:GAF domain-containing protein [Undibacterium sp. Di24W]|uniref:GAF domain-containing protein n=1 Tax=Undibacterium sp. Di24W TaxID=3413033 RepID=UPI003BF1E6D7
MKSPDMPLNESTRIKALVDLNILDTAEEERFDRLTRLAKQFFGVEIALVSLVDSDRQWFKSKQGLTACETGRDISFCGHAILEEEVFHITNALEDARFADNPLVTGAPNIRFYAGAPLRPDGKNNIGTLCIIDSHPRTLSVAELNSLRDLADCVEQEIRLFQQNQQHYALLALTKISSLSNTDYAVLLRQALEIACRFLNMSNGMINRHRSDDCEVIVQWNPEFPCEGSVLTLDQTMCSVSMQSNEITLLPEVSTSPYAEIAKNSLLVFGSYIGVPIHAQNTLFGTLAFSDSLARKPAFFTQVEIEFIKLFSEWVNNTIYEWELASSLKLQQNLAQVISNAQAKFIHSLEHGEGFKSLLHDILDLTGSSYGFIGEVFQDQKSETHLKLFTINRTAKKLTSPLTANECTTQNLKLNALDDLFGAAIRTKSVIILNELTDERMQGTSTHPGIHNFLGLPIYYNEALIATIGIANRPFGYKQDLVNFLQPILLTIAQLIQAARVRASHLDSERRLADIIKGTNIGTWEWNVQTGEASYNQRWAEIVGYTLEELAPISLETWSKLVHPDDLKQSDLLLQRHFSGELDYYEFTSRMRHKDGHWVWILDRGCLISRTDDGKPLLMSGSHADISKQKFAEAQLAHTIDLLEQSNSAAQIGTWELDLNESRTKWSKLTEQIHQVPEGYSCNLEQAILFYKEGKDRDTIQEKINHAIHTGESFDSELRFVTMRGHERWVRVLGLTQINEGRCERLYGTIQDISERKRIETMKSEFISTVSHELRTPLTSISGALGLIVGGAVGELPAKIKSMLHIAHKNSQRLSFLINDLLDMEKLSAGKMHFNMQKVELNKVLKLACESNLAAGIERMISITVDNPHPEIIVTIDQNRFLQVMSNLISNAIKYSPNHGNVSIQVSWREHLIRVSVIDQGPGVPPEFQNSLFQKFVQADSSDTRKQGGTGLGLAISRELMEAMHGSLDFERDRQGGANFYLELQLNANDLE